MRAKMVWVLLCTLGIAFTSCKNSGNSWPDNQPRKIEVLFLGHDSEHHNSEAYMPILASALAPEGINFTYTSDPDDLNDQNLAKFDALMLYANHDEITSSQEEALMDFVAEGNGFLPIHSASYCFRNSDDFVNLVGAQFKEHGYGTFTTEFTNTDHPVVEGLEPFETWDETYVHHMHNEDRTVLMERVEDGHREPWTWVRTHGDGKVFYTAYGHDERTWNQPGFHKLVKNGIVWSVSEDVKEKWEEYTADMPELTYEDRGNIPNYEKRDPAPKYQRPLSPEESKKLIQVPSEFKLELFASEPDIINPIAMTWDEKGRLWVVETVDYPNTVREANGNGDDRIKILEDTDNDGKADKVTVFAENLNIPTSLVLANGGVIVSQAPHFLFLKDTDGDDKADVRETIISGWGTYDTHAGPSNLAYGFDNNIWGSVGYSGFRGEIEGDSLRFRQGFYRFSTDFNNLDFEYLTITSNNTWGLGFNETFDVFGSTANNTHAVYMGIPRKYYEHHEWGEDERRQYWSAGRKKIDGHYAMHPITRNYRQVDFFGGFTAASGFQFYTARQFPKEYWNRVAFVSEPTGNLLHRAIIEKDDSTGFTEKNGWNMMASADEWVSPVEAKVGPDGSLWVLDWYNFIIQHNPTPSEERGGYDAENGDGNAHINPLRDREHGRIWRITYKGAEPYEPMSLSKDDPDALVEALSHDNLFWRLTAQRLLVERGDTDVLADLYDLAENTSVDGMGLNSAALHALWTIHGLGQLDGSNDEAINTAVSALDHPAAGVRKTAVQVLPRTEAANHAILESGILKDTNDQTRLAALLTIIEMESSPAIGDILFKLSQDEQVTEDEWLSEALMLATEKHEAQVQQAAIQGTSKAATQSRNPTVRKASANSIQTVTIRTVKNEMKFNISDFTVKAGKQVKIVFENPDFMQHNLLVLKPGTLEKVGAAADKMAASPDGAEKNYVPEMPEVLYSTALVNPEETITLTFTAPSEPGQYPIVCTIPGHWRLMQGTMTVVGNKQAANI